MGGKCRFPFDRSRGISEGKTTKSDQVAKRAEITCHLIERCRSVLRFTGYEILAAPDLSFAAERFPPEASDFRGVPCSGDSAHPSSDCPADLVASASCLSSTGRFCPPPCPMNPHSPRPVFSRGRRKCRESSGPPVGALRGDPPRRPRAGLWVERGAEVREGSIRGGLVRARAANVHRRPVDMAEEHVEIRVPCALRRIPQSEAAAGAVDASWGRQGDNAAVERRRDAARCRRLLLLRLPRPERPATRQPPPRSPTRRGAPGRLRSLDLRLPLDLLHLRFRFPTVLTLPETRTRRQKV